MPAALVQMRNQFIRHAATKATVVLGEFLQTDAWELY